MLSKHLKITAPDFGGKGGQIAVVAQPYIWRIVAKQTISKVLPPSGCEILIAVSPWETTLDNHSNADSINVLLSKRKN